MPKTVTFTATDIEKGNHYSVIKMNNGVVEITTVIEMQSNDPDAAGGSSNMQVTNSLDSFGPAGDKTLTASQLANFKASLKAIRLSQRDAKGLG